MIDAIFRIIASRPEAIEGDVEFRIIRRRPLLERNIWQGYRSSLPMWAEAMIGVARSAAHRPKRMFRKCAAHKCRRVFYGTSEACKECRETASGNA